MLTLNDGRSELWQWDTGRTLSVDADCSKVHFSNKVFGRSIDVDVVNGAAIIPDILLQTDKDLNVWAFVGTAENGYTKISKIFTVNRRNKPADYVFTPADQITLQTIQHQIGDLSDLTTAAKDTLVAAINEAARKGGGAGSMDLRVADGYVQYSSDGGMTWTNLIAMADLKGDQGEPGKDGHSPVVTATKSGKTTTISVDGAAIATVEDGADGKPGTDGADGVTPHIGYNGNWYLGETDTGKPSRGSDGATGATGATGEKGADGKSAYQYAVEGGYTGTEEEFTAKLAQEKFANPNALTFTGAVTGSYDGSEAVTVNIPTGGGSPGSFTTPELVYQHTCDGTYVSVTDDVPLEDNKIYFTRITIPTGTSQGTFRCLLGGYGNTYTGACVGTITNQHSVLKKQTHSMIMKVENEIIGISYFGANIPESTGYSLGQDNSSKLGSNIYFYSTSNDVNLPQGSKVEVYKLN